MVGHLLLQVELEEPYQDTGRGDLSFSESDFQAEETLPFPSQTFKSSIPMKVVSFLTRFIPIFEYTFPYNIRYVVSPYAINPRKGDMSYP